MKGLFSIKGKTALITGGSRGIGLMMAKGFVNHGAKVYVTSRKKEVCDKTARELSEYGTCLSLPSDLSTEEGINSLIEDLKRKEDRLDILINNAGAAWEAPLESFPDSAWDKVFNVNVKSVFTLTRGLIPFLKAAGSPSDPARVINIGSIAAFSAASKETYSYGPSKAAVHLLTQMLARELAEKNIAVNAIAPGRFPSRMTSLIIKNKDLYESELQAIPFHRYGSEDDIAGLSIFLASRASAYMTGSIVTIDGGFTISGI